LSVTAVIFDYGCVLSLDQPAAERARLEELVGGPELWPAYWALRATYDRGQLSGAEYWRQIGERVGVELDSDRISRLIAADQASWGHPNPPVVRWAEAVAAAGFRTGLISNMPAELAVHVRDRQPWMPRIDWWTFSCDLGTLKPDPVIYRHSLSGLRVDPSAAVFIDDRQENVAAAAELGLRAIHYTGPERLAADLASVDGLPRMRGG
jgi:putative hydrolase of the HAD superfamily